MMIFILIIFALIILLILFNKRAVPVFLYHQVNPISSNVSPELFEEHLKIIKKYNMETITISEYYNKNINKNSMLLTFDDGYYDNFKYVFPLLKKYNMKATIFLNTLYIMDKRETEPEIKDNNTVNLEAIKKYIENGKATINQYMSWEEIKDMYDSGLIDFQSHSHKHMAIFTNPKIEGLTKKDRMEAPELYLYGELEDNLPIFAKRGEYSGKAKIVKKKFFNIFKDFYEDQIINTKKIVLSRSQNLKKDSLEDILSKIKKINKRAVIISHDWKNLKGIDILNNIELNSVNINEYKGIKPRLKNVETSKAKDVFESFAIYPSCKFSKLELISKFKFISSSRSFGDVLRAKGVVELKDKTFGQFDFVKDEFEIRKINNNISSVISFIGVNLNRKEIEKLFL